MTSTLTAAAVPAAPAILVTTAHPSLHQHPGPRGEAVHPKLGRLITPRHTSSVELTARAGITWAADNDCFQGLHRDRYLAMLDRIEGLPGCRFVTVPDIVGDAHATAASFDEWAPELERRGLPLALVAQDGLEGEDLAEWLEQTWPRLSALFIGGSTEWKESAAAADLARAAKDRGLWVHWGRVNTRRRLDLIVATGAADSTDGTKFARFRNTYLNAWLEVLAALERTRQAIRRAAAAVRFTYTRKIAAVETRGTTERTRMTTSIDSAAGVADAVTRHARRGERWLTLNVRAYRRITADQGDERFAVILTDSTYGSMFASIQLATVDVATGEVRDVEDLGNSRTVTTAAMGAALERRQAEEVAR